MFEERPLLRHSYRSAAGLVHVFSDDDGRPLEGGLLDSLHLDDLQPRPGQPPRQAREHAARWLHLGRREELSAIAGPDAEHVLTTVVWCRYVQAKLVFEIGTQHAELRVQGWAELLADGRTVPPPFTCPETGLPSYAIAATDDGRITVPEALGVCQQTGRRVLHSELGTCELSGRRLLAGYLAVCPVTGRRVERAVLATCDMCRQAVDPACLQGGRCLACRSLAAVSPDEPRVALVLGEYPRLARRSHWHLAETAAVYILTSTYFLYRLLIVLDKESLAIQRLAEGPRLTRRWTDVPEDQWPEYLG